MTMQALTADAIARGLWQACGEAPLVVRDPLKARYLLGLNGMPLGTKTRQRHEAGVLPVSYFRRATPRLSRQALREFERIISGGDVLFRDDYHNLVVNQGLNDLLNITVGGNTSPGQDTTWFVGLTDGTPTAAAADTLASHAGWVEVTNFDEVNRVAWVANSSSQSAQSTSNSSAPAVFTINATVTIGGSFLSGVNTGTAGRLYSVGAFTAGDKILNDNDTLSVTATFTAAAA
jgi:hypothetical protein